MWGFGWNQRKRFFGSAKNGPPAKKAKTLATKVTRLQRQVALLKPEVKHIVTLANFVNITAAAGGIQPLVLVDQGTTASERVGDVIRAQSIEIIISEGSVSAGAQVRFIIVKDTQNAGAVPTISGSTSAVMSSFSPSTAFLNPSARPRYKILYDDIHVHETLAYSEYPSSIRRCGFKLNFPITFIGAGGGDYGKNSLWLIVLTNDAAGTMDIVAEYDLAFTDV